MAESVAITAGTGTAIAADEVSGVFHQRVKLSLGADGTAADAPVGGGTEAGALRVTLASDSTGVVSVDDGGGVLTVDGTVAVTNADLTTLAGAVSGTHVQADVLSMPSVAVTNADITTVAGAVSGGHIQADVLALPAVTGTVTAELSATDNAVLDAIDTAVDIVAGAVAGGHMQVDVLSAPATAVTNADLTTIAGAVAGGHVQADVLSLPAVVLGAGTAEIGKLAAGSAAIGSVIAVGGTAADAALTAAPVTIGGKASAAAPTDMSADGDVVNASFDRHGCLRVNIHENSVALAQGTNDIGGVNLTKIAGASPQVSNGTHTGALRVAIASDSSMPSQAVTNAGTFAVQATLAAGTAGIGKLTANSGVDIGDVDVTSLPALAAGTNLVGKVGIDQTTPGTTNKVSIGTDGTVTANLSATDNAVLDAIVEALRPTTRFTASVHDHNTAQSAHSLVAADATLSHYVTDIILSNGATAGIIEVHDTDRTITTGDIYMAANSSGHIALVTPMKGAAAHAIEFTSTTVTTHTVTVCGYTAA